MESVIESKCKVNDAIVAGDKPAKVEAESVEAKSGEIDGIEDNPGIVEDDGAEGEPSDASVGARVGGTFSF